MLHNKRAIRCIAGLLISSVLSCCFTLFAGAASGYTEERFMSMSQTPGGNVKYIVISRADLEDYAAFGTVEIRTPGKTFDFRGETFQVCFDCYASHVEYADGKTIPEEMSPVRTVVSFTADENTGPVRLESVRAEYEKITMHSGNMQYLWQIEADGDYNITGKNTGTGFFADMGQFYGR